MDTSDTSRDKKRAKEQKKEKNKSKKRDRIENEEIEVSAGTKKSKLAQGEAQSIPTSKKIWEDESSSKWSSKLYRVMWDKVVVEGHIFVVKCGEDSKCAWTLCNLDGSLAPGSFAVKATEKDASSGQKCSRHPLEHRIMWHEDVEPVKGDGVAKRIQRLFSMLKACRWMCTTWHQGGNSLYWMYLMVTRIQQEMEGFQEVMKSRPNSKISQPLKNLLSSFSSDMAPKFSKIAVSLKIASTSSPQNVQPNHLIEALQTRLLTLAAIDNFYYLLFHYSLLSPLTPTAQPSEDASSTPSSSINPKQNAPKAKRHFEILPPPAYFKLFNDPFDEHVAEMESTFWLKEVDLVTRKRLQSSYGTFEDAIHSMQSNPLLAIWYFKFIEYIRFAYVPGLATGSRAMEDTIAAVTGGSKGGSKKTSRSKRVKQLQVAKEQASEPLCDDALQTWRDSSRDWPSLLYAYAVPSQLALKTIAKYGPIVEIGAGTGYWASLLKKMSIETQSGAVTPKNALNTVSSSTEEDEARAEKLKVVAFDSVPPTLAGEQNEFHANVPPFCTVQKAGIPVIRKFQDHALFMCFPPPDDTMAMDSLRAYPAGKTVIHIGEWQGFTGSSDFEEMLFKYFDLIEKVELPNWQDTCYDLTVWRRKSNISSTPTALHGNDQTPTHSLNINTKMCYNCQKSAAVLRRCKCCRVAAFCSKSCASYGSQLHSSVHHMQGVFLKELDTSLDYNQPKHYRALRTSD